MDNCTMSKKHPQMHTEASCLAVGGPPAKKIRFDTHEQGGQGGGTDDEQVQGGTCSNSYNYSQTPAVTTSCSLSPSKPCCTNRRSSLTTGGWLLLTAFRLLVQSFRLLHISCPIVEWQRFISSVEIGRQRMPCHLRLVAETCFPLMTLL